MYDPDWDEGAQKESTYMTNLSWYNFTEIMVMVKYEAAAHNLLTYFER